MDAETEFDRSGPGGRELRADPRAVADYLARIDDAAPQHLRGFLWFRLAVAGDRRGWSAATLAAVIARQPLVARFRASARMSASGSHDLRVSNTGNLDSMAPSIVLPEHCRLADALGQYRLQAGVRMQLVPGSRAWLAAGDSVIVGWVRCDKPLDPQWELP